MGGDDAPKDWDEGAEGGKGVLATVLLHQKKGENKRKEIRTRRTRRTRRTIVDPYMKGEDLRRAWRRRLDL